MTFWIFIEGFFLGGILGIVLGMYLAVKYKMRM